MHLLFDDSDQNISGNRAPDLGFDRIFALPDESFNAQVLLDPLEEQLHLPATFVQCRDGQGRKGSVVGQKNQGFSGIRVLEADSAQQIGVCLGGVVAVQGDSLIADYAGGPVGWERVQSVGIHAALGAGYEKGSGLVHGVQPGKIEIAPVHHIKSPSLDGQDVQDVHIVGFAVADMDEGWDVVAQVQQGMQFDRRFGGTKWRPGEQRQTQVDGGGVQGVDGVRQIDAEIFVAIEVAGPTNEQSSQIGPDAPVATLVRICQSGSSDRIPESHSVQFGAVGDQAGFDIAQTLAVGELSESHSSELFVAVQFPDAGVAGVTTHNSRKTRPRHKPHELRKQRFPCVHGNSSKMVTLEN